MTKRNWRIRDLGLLLLLCSLGQVSTSAQGSVSPPIVIAVSANESGAPVVSRGWPLLVNVMIMNKNAYQNNVPVTLSQTWKSSLRFTVTDSLGTKLPWTFHGVSVRDEGIVLDSVSFAQTGYWLEPNETSQVPLGRYELVAILDSSAYGSFGSNVLSARSGGLNIEIKNESTPLNTEQRTERDLLLANLNILKGDDKKALEYVSGILGYNARDLRALSLIADIFEREGNYGGALYAYAKGLEIFYQANPNPPEPPFELMNAQRALYQKLNNAASFVVTLAAKDSTHPLYKRGSPFSYFVDNIPARDLQLVRGRSYTFSLKNIPSTDPLYFSTSSRGGGAEPYNDGVTSAPADSNETVTIAVRASAPNLLYYQSSKNEYAGWKMHVADNENVTSAPESNATYLREYSLSLAYPNPFNPTTRIQYRIPSAVNVQLTVADILGRLVATLVDERKEAGSYQVQWNPQLPSGVYFFRIQAGEFRETQKVILLR